MTPTTGTTGTIRHPDVSEISDLTEGLLSPTRSAEVRHHLGGCTLCADVRASLEEIRAVLGTLPGPARMPADIAGRIDAALAAEALLDSTTPQASDEDSRPASASAARPRPTDRDVSRETSPAGHPNGSSGPGRRRARRRIAVLTGLAGAAACALGIFLFSDLSGPPSQDATARRETTSSAAQPPTDGAYTSQGLRSSVKQLLDSGQGAKAATQGEQNNTYGMENTPAPGIAPNDRQAASVPACVQEATGRPETPIASERGSYQGTPVLLLVLPHPGDSSRVDAYLVDTGCENTTPATPGKVLLTNTYPR
ncbi:MULTISPECIES: hypothetical protein [unclassified Streptomyces]|uniref:hypothetical protein n=1 Tax=unclassified Streptomyces TaxID=2593676 RepID=UPI002254DDFF|nr:hypothetical protein [Streptomyces sp. NBC_00047]MCX5606843.1 hypothetical protein [Streptomyces sp. NBC_00047]